ncbi:MAG: glycosyltransferase, partial [Pseudomonadota bacterium]
MLSVIIPTRNANASLPRTLACLAERKEEAGIAEIIVADGGSVTAPDVSEFGAVLLRGEPGRGVQMAHGATAATGDWLLFLHADTVLGKGWARAVRAHMANTRQRRKTSFSRILALILVSSSSKPKTAALPLVSM